MYPLYTNIVLFLQTNEDLFTYFLTPIRGGVFKKFLTLVETLLYRRFSEKLLVTFVAFCLSCMRTLKFLFSHRCDLKMLGFNVKARYLCRVRNPCGICWMSLQRCRKIDWKPSRGRIGNFILPKTY